MEKPPIIIGIMSSIMTFIFEVLIIVNLYNNASKYDNRQIITLIIAFILLGCGLLYFKYWTIQMAKEMKIKNDKEIGDL